MGPSFPSAKKSAAVNLHRIMASGGEGRWLSISSIYFIIELKASVGSIRLGQFYGPQGVGSGDQFYPLSLSFFRDMDSFSPWETL